MEMKSRKTYAKEVLNRLKLNYPDVHCALTHKSPFELLVATILSAQCTDKRVNMITPELFRRFPDAESMAAAPIAEVEELIRTAGVFRNKSKNIKLASSKIVEDFGSNVPDTMENLLKLPGVGRKTANVILGNAFSKNVGVVVDTHVKRLSNRLGFADESDPDKIEKDLMKIIPRDDWALFAHLMIRHGRMICNARNPDCPNCFLKDICPSSTA